jgi:hypothetical protein
LFVPKAPTRIAYATENPAKLNEDAWGYSVKPGLRSNTWTKLFLDEDTKFASFLLYEPDVANFSLTRSTMLPPKPSTREICRDYLTELYGYTIEEIKKAIGLDIFDLTPLECWVTVPAIWPLKAQEAIRRAAYEAGFGARTGDSIHIIPEPEAAAIAILQEHISPQVGFTFLQ